MDLSSKTQSLKWAAYILFTVWCWQVFHWRFQTLQVSKIQMKSILRLASFDDRLELGAICNGLGDFSCAIDVFEELTENHPQSRVAWANLGIAQAQNGDCKHALRTFEVYTKGGTQGGDVAYWKSICLLAQNRWREARGGLYEAVLLSPQHSKAPEELIHQLIQNGYAEEALSVIGALSQGAPLSLPRWKELYSVVVNQQGVLPPSSLKTIRIPSLDGQSFWLPVQMTPGAPPEFALVDLEQTGVILTEKSLQPQLAARDPQSHDEEVLIRDLRIGSWVIQKVPFRICTDCKSTIGRDILDKFEVGEEMEGAIRFLTLTSKI